MDTKYQ